MNGMFSPIIFYPLAIALILATIFAISFRNIFYSLLSSIVVFFITGVLFYILGSEYNAIIQIAIYGVAVPVILGLAIMFTNTKPEEKKEAKDTKGDVSEAKSGENTKAKAEKKNEGKANKKPEGQTTKGTGESTGNSTNN